MIEYGIKPFDICSKNPELWNWIKSIYIVSFVFVDILFNNFLYSFILKVKKFQKNNKKIINIKNKKINKKENSELKLLIGANSINNNKVYINEKGLYQNFLITGTIGSGKTSSAMYPFTRQLIKYNSKNRHDKIGMLVLDVKGNYFNQVKKYCKTYGLLDDLIVLELGGKHKYNPLDKPNLKPQVIANRLKSILELFSENNSESYWLDKVEQILTECIKFCRLYNKGYVNFVEIHKLISNENYYKEKVECLRKIFLSSKFTMQEIYDLNSSLDFFQNEFYKLDSRTISILKSEVSRITNVFISDFDALNTFCCNQEALTFTRI